MDNNSLKSMVALSVEVVLMRKGGAQYQQALARLEADYGAKIFDCFEHPQYLKAVLRQIYAKEYPTILESLEAELGEIASERGVVEFLKALKQ